ncbi:class I SAM-dependent methyltransferase [Roseobacter sp. CCS2]|uniref:class I SAM-dependent methyltransferase n=1 Tax=Roseobacter sp. CCS2 TaxID=391593 RepID=UPI0003200018|nr:class I SAM-dependent methyltransferase [Roseobacter sp. CCS2]
MFKKSIGQAHEKLVFNRRVRVLVEKIGALLPPGSDMLDVGTGDGQIAKMIGARQDGTSVQGIDIMKRDTIHIPVTLFDGTTIPMDDNSVDVVTFVDVLHHTDDPQVLISEASRVARKAVIIKDHLSENKLDHMTLRAMDWVGNAPHGVVLPYNYAPRRDWDEWFAKADLATDKFITDIPLYPAPLSWVFGRKLHFVARLTPNAA